MRGNVLLRRALRILTAGLLGLCLAGCEDDGGDLALIQYEVQDQDRIGTDADRLSSFIRMAARSGAQLVVTPETPLHRFTPYEQNGTTMSDFAAEYDRMAGHFSSLAADLGITLIVGLREPAGSGTFNSAVCFGPGGEILGIHRKHWPSNEEARYTSSGGAGTIIGTPVGRIGLAICKDVHSPAVQNAYGPGSIDLFVLISADPDGQNFADIGNICARAGCRGVLVNQDISAGNSATVSANGDIDYFGSGEDIFYTDLP